MPSPEIALVAVLAVLGWFWLDSLKAREAAIRAARAACDAEGLLFLDDTVSISGMKTARDDRGHIKLQRSYEFEYSDTGNNRRTGLIVLVGHSVVLFNVG